MVPSPRIPRIDTALPHDAELGLSCASSIRTHLSSGSSIAFLKKGEFLNNHTDGRVFADRPTDIALVLPIRQDPIPSLCDHINYHSELEPNVSSPRNSLPVRTSCVRVSFDKKCECPTAKLAVEHTSFLAGSPRTSQAGPFFPNGFFFVP